MTAYYNEIDPVAAQWLRNLIAADLIAPGEVDERSISDVTPADLMGFTQCHFFAGIGLWSGALRAAGWPDDRPIWSGSCPCQDFSNAGQRKGFDGERHLWPDWFQLIAVCRPPVIVGEQVASALGLGWYDLVSDDLGAAGYANGALDLSAAGFGLGWRGSAYAQWLERALLDCPDPMVARHLRNFASWADQSLGLGGMHIRQRLYFVGLSDPEHDGRNRAGGPAPEPDRDQPTERLLERGRASGGLSDAHGGDAREGREQPGGQHGLAEDHRGGDGAGGQGRGGATDADLGADAPDGGRSPFDWLFCRDGSWRAVESGSFPLAHAVAGRVAKLRAIGNGLDFETAVAHCQAVKELADEAGL